MRNFKAVGPALFAILMWSTLALAGSGLQDIPRFLLLGITFLTSGLLTGFRRDAWRIPFKVLMTGTAGIFGYHYFYFTAFTKAPAVQVNLINYLWPLFIVVLTPLFFSSTRLHIHHVLGAFLGLTGAVLIATGGKTSLDFRYLAGYLIALSAAITWALYSLMTKRLAPFPTSAVGVFLLISGIISLVLFFFTGGSVQKIVSLDVKQWVFLVLVGLGPMGAAFFLWDAALKAGDPRIIGSLAYLTPLLSTLNLWIFAGQRLTALTLLAMALIIGGAILGSISRPKNAPKISSGGYSEDWIS